MAGSDTGDGALGGAADDGATAGAATPASGAPTGWGPGGGPPSLPPPPGAVDPTWAPPAGPPPGGPVPGAAGPTSGAFAGPTYGADPTYGAGYAYGAGYGYGAPQPTLDKGARTSLIIGIVGVFICGVILGPAAFIEGLKARKRIRESGGTLTGDGLALAGMIVGAAVTLLYVGYIIVLIVASSRPATRGALR